MSLGHKGHHGHHHGRWIGRGMGPGYGWGPGPGHLYYDSGCPWGTYPVWRADVRGTPYLACVPARMPMLGLGAMDDVPSLLILGGIAVGLIWLVRSS